MGDSRVLYLNKMILIKDNFSSIGSDNTQASAGTIYKLLLLHKYTVEVKENIPGIKYLIKNNEVIADVNINDVVYYLHTHHTTYKLYAKRLDEALKSKFEYKKQRANEYESILRQLEDIYIAKYLFKQLPFTIRVDYLKQ